jgi:hypothetical protein
MTQTQYKQFLDDPAKFLNAGPVRRLRINVPPVNPGSAVFLTNPQSTANFPGAVPVHFQWQHLSASPIWWKYDDTGIPPTSAVWAQITPPVGGQFVNDRAYYLKWSVDEAYALELGHTAQIFLTAQVDGCGILVFQTPLNLIVVHHNIQVAAVGKSFFQRIFESRQAYGNRDQENRFDVRAQALQALSGHIMAKYPNITRGAALDVSHYMATGNAASVFGVTRGRVGPWRIFVNSKIGTDYHTDMLFG